MRHDYTRSFVADTRHLDLQAVAAIFAELEREARAALRDEGVDDDGVTFRRTLDLRYKDQVWEVSIDATDVNLAAERAREEIEERFHRQHEALYDFSQPGYPCELISLTLTAFGRSPRLAFRAPEVHEAAPTAPERSRPARFRRGAPPVETPVRTGDSFTDGAGWFATFHAVQQTYVLAAERPDE